MASDARAAILINEEYAGNLTEDDKAIVMRRFPHAL